MITISTVNRAPVLGAALLFLGPQVAAASILGPSSYASFDDSPFKNIAFKSFILENFEDHSLNSLGLIASSGGVASVVAGPANHDSVDIDDGKIDGSGLSGDSYTASDRLFFTFDPKVLGTLPTHAGLVWADGGGTLSFAAWGPGGAYLGGISVGVFSGFGDHRTDGRTAEDAFFGVVNPAGISAFEIVNSAGFIEVDHIQYGSVTASFNIDPNTPTVPIPPGLLLLTSALCGLARFRHRASPPVGQRQGLW